MINNLLIANFQSHKQTKLEFSPGLNVIIGTSDSGKSAILRALKFVYKNRPSGDSIRSFWGGDTIVQVSTDTASVTRKKGKIEEYLLQKDAEEELSFKAFKTSVPDEVINALNFSDINLQSQLDPPFLLNKSSGEVATHFNKIANIDKIDIATTNINSWCKKLTNDIKYSKEQKEKWQEELLKYTNLQKMEIEIDVLEESQKQCTVKSNKINQLSKLISAIQKVEEVIEKESEILTIESLVNIIIEDIESRKVLKNKISAISSMLSDIEYIDIQIKEEKQLIEAEKPLNNLLDLIANKNTLSIAVSSLNKLLLSISSINSLLKENEADLALKSKVFKENFPEVCPLCDSVINHKH